MIGFTKFAYDLWGLTVNAASRMESTAPAGRIQV
ncbi:MAG: adenylate/guanylate cyclase domain-containing protein, partial [Gammaproteobacteria bacterium]